VSLSLSEGQFHSIHRPLQLAKQPKPDIPVVDRNTVEKWVADLLRTSAAGAEAGAAELSAQQIKQLIRDELELYSADRIARPDFALESAGGMK
jgi:hypothetical protein